MGVPTLSAEQLAKLNELLEIREKMKALEAAKLQILRLEEEMQDLDRLTDEFVNERRLLFEEKQNYIEKLRLIQNDMAVVESFLEASKLEKENLKRKRDSIMADEYGPLKETVDKLRAQKGLPRLPSLQEEHEQWIANYLEKRRQEWHKLEQTEAKKPRGK